MNFCELDQACSELVPCSNDKMIKGTRCFFRKLALLKTNTSSSWKHSSLPSCRVSAYASAIFNVHFCLPRTLMMRTLTKFEAMLESSSEGTVFHLAVNPLSIRSCRVIWAFARNTCSPRIHFSFRSHLANYDIRFDPRVAVSRYLPTWENSYKCRWCSDVAKANANRNSSAVLVLPLLYSEVWAWCEM